MGFRKDALQEAFAVFYRKIQMDGRYHGLVMKYYPEIFDYYQDFLRSNNF